jgi:hypothetical protein
MALPAPYAFARYRHDAPPLREVRPKRWAACHLQDCGVRDPLAQTAGAA